MQKANNIKDDDDSNYVYGADQPFAPRYPVFNFMSPRKSITYIFLLFLFVLQLTCYRIFPDPPK